MKVYSEMYIVGGPFDVWPVGNMLPWILLVIPVEIFISAITGKHLEDMQVTIAIPNDQFDHMRQMGKQPKTWSQELMDEPLFAWILILLTIVLHFVIYFFDAKCETITHFGAWGGVRAFIHIGTVLITLAGALIYLRANCFCCKRDMKLKFWHKIEKMQDVTRQHLYDFGYVKRREAEMDIEPGTREWCIPRLKKTQSNFVKPFFFIMTLVFLHLANTRLGSETNALPDGYTMIVCTIGKVCFCLFFVNWLMVLKEWIDEDGQLREFPKDKEGDSETNPIEIRYAWLKYRHGQLFVGWLILVMFIRLVAAFTGEFQKNYFGKDLECPI